MGITVGSLILKGKKIQYMADICTQLVSCSSMQPNLNRQ